jgi:hypothetical protein
MPKCFARVIARQWISLLAAAACKRIENPAARKIGPFVTEDTCPPLILCGTHKKVYDRGNAFAFTWTQRPSETVKNRR